MVDFVIDYWACSLYCDYDEVFIFKLGEYISKYNKYIKKVYELLRSDIETQPNCIIGVLWSEI